MTRSHTFLVADLAAAVSSSVPVDERNAGTLFAEFAMRIQPLVRQARAGEIRISDQGLVIRASTPSSGVRLAQAIAEQVSGRDQFPAVRIGVHAGMAVERDGAWRGPGVNVTAAVAGLATASEVLVTEEAVKWVTEQRFERLGAAELRNAGLPVTLYQLAQPSSSPLTVDPVCQVILAQHRAAASYECELRAMYFCSQICAQAFAADPERYTSLGRPARDDHKHEPQRV